jgi:hypothetical protein
MVAMWEKELQPIIPHSKLEGNGNCVCYRKNHMYYFNKNIDFILFFLIGSKGIHSGQAGEGL